MPILPFISHRLRPGLIAMALALPCLIGCDPDARDAASTQTPVEFEFQALDGRDVSLAALRGKVVLLDFWATWCPPCIEALPELKSLYERHRTNGFEIVGFSFDEDADELRDFIAEYDIPWPQYHDGMEADSPAAEKFGIESLPTVWLLDRRGVPRHTDADTDLEEKLIRLLNESAE